MLPSSRTALRESLAQEICQNGRCSPWGTFFSWPFWLNWLVSSQTSFQWSWGSSTKINWLVKIYPFLHVVFWNILSNFRLPPKTITHFFPTCWLAHNILNSGSRKAIFSHGFGRFLRFWGGHFVGVATTRLLWSRRVAGLRFANEEVTELEAGHGLYLGKGRGWEVWGSDAPQNHGGAKRSLLLWVVGHVVTNSTKGDLLHSDHPTPQQISSYFLERANLRQHQNDFFQVQACEKYFWNARTSY